MTPWNRIVPRHKRYVCQSAFNIAWSVIPRSFQSRSSGKHSLHRIAVALHFSQPEFRLLSSFHGPFSGSIRVRAYVRPRAEQPETLRPTYPGAIRNLETRGVQVLCRPGMHEKVAAIDGRILWHGSLNILSHNDSRESMLRFESRDLVHEILQGSWDQRA